MRAEARWSVLMLLSVVLASVLVGCPSFFQTSAGVASIDPSTATPGEALRVVADAPVFASGSRTRVTIASTDATIDRIISSTEVEVTVPSLPAGTAEVRIVEEGKLPGRAQFLAVLPPSG